MGKIKKFEEYDKDTKATVQTLDKWRRTTKRPLGQCCGDCVFWRPGYSNPEDVECGAYEGRCQHDPPQFVRVITKTMSQWPSTQFDDWCGKFKDREYAPLSPIMADLGWNE